MNPQSLWSLLVLTLPTENATARMRIYRALKAKGCGVLRDGVYVLPHSSANETVLRELAAAIVDSGGTSHLLRTPSIDASQEAEFKNLFDRSTDFDAFIHSLAQARKTISGQSVAETARVLRRLRKDYESIRAIDYFPTEATTRAEVAWLDFVALVDTLLSPGEPQPAERTIARLRRDDYRGRAWATRQRMWIDRVASAWLIRRFIDPNAQFLWLSSPEACPSGALGFDFEGAAFTHVGERVTFEVLLASFGFEDDSALLRLGQLVHALDVGGPAPAEAAGFEAVMAGTRDGVENDDQLLEQMSPVLDALYTHFAASAKQENGGRS